MDKADKKLELPKEINQDEEASQNQSKLSLNMQQRKGNIGGLNMNLIKPVSD